MRVLISGGGIAGLTLAYWLHQYTIPVVVIEQAQGLRRDGYAIDFLGTGDEVAERMSLIDRLSSQQIPFDRRPAASREVSNPSGQAGFSPGLNPCHFHFYAPV